MRHTLLLVDDERESRESLDSIISISGFVVTSVPTIGAAIDRLRDGLEVCAILLNVLDTWTALVALHAEGTDGANIPVLLAHARAIDESRARMLGARDILQKPLDYGVLIAAIERHCRRVHPTPSIRILLTPTPS